MMYAKKPDSEQIGFFHLGGAKVDCSIKDEREYRFRITLPQRTYVLQTEDNAKLQEWLTATREIATASVQLEHSIFRQSFSFGSGPTTGKITGASSSPAKESAEKGEGRFKIKLRELQGDEGGLLVKKEKEKEELQQVVVAPGKSLVCRKEASRSSTQSCKLAEGTVCEVLEKAEVEGKIRLRVRTVKSTFGIRSQGWCSLRAKNGDLLLAPVKKDGGDEAGSREKPRVRDSLAVDWSDFK